MVSWSDVKKWTPEALVAAYDQFARSEAAVQSAGDALWSAAASFSNEGGHADAARGNLQERRASADHLEALLSDLMIATQEAESEVNAVKRDVESAERYADQERLTIDSSGGVSIKPEVRAEAEADALRENLAVGAPVFTYDMMPVWIKAELAKQELERFIEQLLRRATDADTAYTSSLNAIKAGEASSLAVAAAAGSSTEGIDPKALLKLLEGERDMDKVRGAWDSLSPEQQQALIDGHPEEIGALNGVPIEARIRANDLNIDREIGELDREIAELEEKLDKLDPDKRDLLYMNPGQINRENNERRLIEKQLDELRGRRDFYEHLKSGDGNGAVLFDPDNNRIIEMIGDPSRADVKEVVTFVPGTNTNLDNLREYSDVPRYLVEQGEQTGKPTIGFNFYDGRFEGDGNWIDWFGERANHKDSHLHELGGNLAEFQEALAAEDFSRRADNNVIGHSAGHSVVTASEVSGDRGTGPSNARYDHVHSLSGSYAPKGWEAQTNTEYDHYAYYGEPIHVLDGNPFRGAPHRSPVWENHYSTALDAGDSLQHKLLWPNPINSMDLHTRTADGPERNGPILDHLQREIFKD